MSDAWCSVGNTLTVELVCDERSGLLIARDGGGQVFVELSEVQHLAEVLGHVAADLVGYQVGDYVSWGNGDDWRQLVGRTVIAPDGRCGKVMGPVGDWSKPAEYGCLIVTFPDRGPEVHRIADVELVRQGNPVTQLDLWLGNV